MLERVFGPAMLSIPVQLAELLARLHSLDPAPVRAALATADLPPDLAGESRRELWGPLIAAGRLHGLRDAATWIDMNRPEPPSNPSICHGDFHPLNVMMDGKEVTGVIDWSSMRVMDPAWDVGAAVALFGHGPVDLPGPFIPLVNLVRNRLKDRFLRTYLSHRPLHARSLEYYEAMRLLGFMAEVGEYRLSRTGAISPNDKPTAFNSDRVLSRIIQRFTMIAGVTPSLPPDPSEP
jgi:aminoglycoside phosphotransferase (APT) family kinase protein